MSTYAIGDVQGCFDELQTLLTLVDFNPNKDTLWFTGDLVNRGPKSLEVLRFISKLPGVVTVLGNHDLTLLALAYTDFPITKHTLQTILDAPDREELLTWLRLRPLLHYDAIKNYVLVHAGFPPYWNLQETQQYALEVESCLQSSQFPELLTQMFGNDPKRWDPSLKGWPRLRFIINALTRLRFCDQLGNIDLTYKGKIASAPPSLLPWFAVPNRATQKERILFGHWAALEGHTSEPNVFALDTGCFWGGSLTALRLEDGKKFATPCKSQMK